MKTFAILLMFLVASAYAGDILDLIEDCGKQESFLTWDFHPPVVLQFCCDIESDRQIDKRSFY